MTPRPCSVGVGRIVDDEGVDFALDLRDYLRVRGPCRDVRLVVDAASDQTDLVVSGRLGGGRVLGPTPEHSAGVALIIAGGVGGGVTAGAFLLVGVLGQPNATQSAGQQQSDQKTFDTLTTVGLVAGAVGLAVVATGVVLLVDNGGAKEMKADPLDAELEITRGGDTVARLELRDTAMARGASVERTPTHARGDEFAPLSRVVPERVFEHVAAKLDELASTAPRTGTATGPRE
jgi:hypothetical protein